MLEFESWNQTWHILIWALSLWIYLVEMFETATEEPILVPENKSSQLNNNLTPLENKNIQQVAPWKDTIQGSQQFQVWRWILIYHMLHGTNGIFTYHKFKPNVGLLYMEHMG